MVITSGCQLLIDNRNRESGAVVVVPSEEWDSMRQNMIAAENKSVPLEINDRIKEVPVKEIIPIPGSENITFTSYTSASLGGCTTNGVIEVRHRGDFNEALTLLKNKAYRLSSNRLISVAANNEQINYANIITIEARMLTCPIKLARGN